MQWRSECNHIHKLHFSIFECQQIFVLLKKTWRTVPPYVDMMTLCSEHEIIPFFFPDNMLLLADASGLTIMA
jgi:hypothetical protein